MFEPQRINLLTFFLFSHFSIGKVKNIQITFYSCSLLIWVNVDLYINTLLLLMKVETDGRLNLVATNTRAVWFYTKNSI